MGGETVLNPLSSEDSRRQALDEGTAITLYLMKSAAHAHTHKSPMIQFCRTRYLLALLCALFLSVSGQNVLAQSNDVEVRSGLHDGYMRIVFDWPVNTAYQVRSTGNNLEVTFDDAANYDISRVQAGAPGLIDSVQASGNTAIFVLSGDYDVRDFRIGSRIVLDISGPVIASGSAAPSQRPPPEPEPERPPPPAQSVHMPEPPADQDMEAALERAQQALAPVEQAVVVERAPPPLAAQSAVLDSHVIAVTTTEISRLAAFRYAGRLWLVFDRDDLDIAPLISGPDAEAFPDFTRKALPGGQVFSMPVSSDINIYAEGGGLVWRVILTPETRRTRPVQPERINAAGNINRARGGELIWPMDEIGAIITFADEDTGVTIRAAPVEGSAEFSGPRQEFVDFIALESAVGLAVIDKTDDLKMSVTEEGVKLSHPEGLALAFSRDVRSRIMGDDLDLSVGSDPIEDEGEDGPMRRIYDFERWMMGGKRALFDNQKILLARLADQEKVGRVQDLLRLAKMNLSNGKAPEALGFLRFAENEMPEIVEAAEFLAVRGAAYVLAGQCERGLRDFLKPQLDPYGEIAYWQSYAYACLEDWRQARETIPGQTDILLDYPSDLLADLGVKLAEVSLRAGEVDKARSILEKIEGVRLQMPSHILSAVDYLKGEAARQEEDFDTALSLWEELAEGQDDFYRARAGLALVMLGRQRDTIPATDAIDKLEGLRYAWRGDELETLINFQLGRLYLEEDRYLKAFSILRDAVSMSPDSDIGREVTSFMQDAFVDLLMEDPTLSPLEAVQVYEEFTELTPLGDMGNALVQRLADRLMEADLLNRATDILEHQVEFRLQGSEKARVATKLAATQLLNNQPDDAIASLNTAQAIYLETEGVNAREEFRKIELMRARALSQTGRPEEALLLLGRFDPAPDVNRLRADIAWQAGLWEDAVDALQDLIIDAEIDLERPLSGAQADLILNRAVALNLAGNRVGLANMRARYGEAMRQTGRARLFDVVTRSRQDGLLADRGTLSAIVAEVDIFRDFLEAYRSADE